MDLYFEYRTKNHIEPAEKDQKSARLTILYPSPLCILRELPVTNDWELI